MGIEKLTITFPRGSDIAEEVAFEDDSQNPPQPINMTGWNLEVFEAGPAGATEAYVESNASFTWVDQANGIARFSLPWSNSAPDFFTVRLRATRVADNHDQGIDEILVRYV